MAENPELALLQTALAAPQRDVEQTALRNLLFARLRLAGLTIDSVGLISSTIPFGGGARLNVKSAGIVKGDGVTDDTVGIQAQIDALLAARGGCLDFPSGNYLISAALRCLALTSGCGVTLCGQGMFSTTITQTTVGADVLVFGETGQEHGDFMGARDLTTVGGRRALSLNNCLHGHWECLRLTSAVVGLYTQGQCESHTFRDLYCIGCSSHGIHAGNTNGGTGLVNLDYPILSKSMFDHVHISGTTGGTALLLSAGTLSVQQTSGGVYFKHLIFDSNAKSALWVEHATDVLIDGFGSEDYVDADNTYDLITVSSDSQVTIRQSILGHASFNVAGNWRYYLNAIGKVTLQDSVIGSQGAAATKDIAVGDTLNMYNCTITGASAITFAGSSQQKSNLFNVRDTNNLAIYQYPHYFGDSVTYLGELDVDASAISFYNKSVNPASLNEFYGIHVHNNGAGSGGGNLGVGTKTTADFGGGSCVIALRKTVNPPTTDPTTAGILYVDSSGNLKYRSSGGTVTTVAPV